jgi:hypothetical protein
MHRKGFNSVNLIAVIVFVCLLLMIVRMLPPRITDGHGEPVRRESCASSLQQIFKSMVVYANDNGGTFPMIPLGKGEIVGDDKSVNNLKPNKIADPHADIPPEAGRSVSQNLWLLCREGYAQPELFLCHGTGQPSYDLVHGAIKKTYYFVDFPWEEPNVTISYSFIQPWSKFTNGHSTAETWHPKVDARVVIGADANNGSQPDFKADSFPLRYKDMKQFVNSTNHNSDAQNVLYGDGHAIFKNSAYVGVNGDNIYTALPADYTGKPGDTAGILSVRPRDPFDPKINKPDEWDTVLIPVRDADLNKWNRKP